jgi:hypothetical protein
MAARALWLLVIVAAGTGCSGQAAPEDAELAGQPGPEVWAKALADVLEEDELSEALRDAELEERFEWYLNRLCEPPRPGGREVAEILQQTRKGAWLGEPHTNYTVDFGRVRCSTGWVQTPAGDDDDADDDDGGNSLGFELEVLPSTDFTMKSEDCHDPLPIHVGVVQLKITWHKPQKEGFKLIFAETDGDNEEYLRLRHVLHPDAPNVTLDVTDLTDPFVSGAALDVWVAKCFEGTRTVSVWASWPPEPELGILMKQATVSVTITPPAPPPPPPPGGGGSGAQLYNLCKRGEEMVVAKPGTFGQEQAFVVGGEAGGSVCTETGTETLDAIGETHCVRVFPSTTVNGTVVDAAVLFAGDQGILHSHIGNGEFGAGSVFGFAPGNTFTDCVATGDPETTDQFLLVNFEGRGLLNIAPTPGFWALLGIPLADHTVLPATNGGPVTAYRAGRDTDIFAACEPSLTDPGNLVQVEMNGDTASSSSVVAQTGAMPRRARGIGNSFGVTCYGSDVLSLFNIDDTGAVGKVEDVPVGNEPLGLSVKRLGAAGSLLAQASGDLAYLVANSGDNSYTILIVAANGQSVLSVNTYPAPEGILGLTDVQWGEGDDAYFLGRDSQNVARIDTGVE